MSAHLGRIALMVVMTHGFRTLGKISNPRWAGLALGLPCSTVVALVGGGADRGVDYAVTMSGMSLIGLAGAVSLPLAFAQAIRRGWGLPLAIGLGVGGYLIVSLGVGRMVPIGGNTGVGVALMAVLAAGLAAGRMSEGKGAGLPRRHRLSTTSIRVFRTVVPIGCLWSSLLMGEAFGPEIAGLMSTFPGVTLTVLLLTHLESGPASVIRMAKALPAGNLGMVAFLAAFQFACPVLGLAWGTFSGYLAAVAVLILVIAFDRLGGRMLGEIRSRLDSSSWWLQLEDESLPPITPSWPKAGRRFSPLIEPYAS